MTTNVDPFEALRCFDDKDATSQEAKRTAFRHNRHAIIVPGEASECEIARDGWIVRKMGSRVRIEESIALKFAHSLQLPVPVVRGTRSLEHGIEISMDFVDGECLEEAWNSLSAHDKQNIAQDLRRIVSTMRKATTGRPNIHAFDAPIRDCRQLSDSIGGPFNSEADFNESFVLDLLVGTPVPIRRALNEALGNDNKIMFTHGDLTPRNIIIKGNCVEGLLDWEYAGWYPEYWEYVKFFERPTKCKDWKDYAGIIFEREYQKDLITFQALARWQKP